MADKKKLELNDEQIVSYLQDIVGKIKTGKDLDLLDSYRRLFRKAVPFTLRAYFAAWILKEIDNGRSIGKPGEFRRGDRSDRNRGRDRNERGDRSDRSDRSDRPDRNESRGERGDRNDRSARQDSRLQDSQSAKKDRSRQNETRRGEPRVESVSRSEQPKPEPRPSLPEDVSTTLFVSIGRNRRVYPRDLIGLILQTTGVDREHIGDIRVLDNYSFVQVITEDAAKIIESLNEFDYRGRKLAVSYSRKREDSPESAESGDESASDSSSTDGYSATDDSDDSVCSDDSTFADDAAPDSDSESGSDDGQIESDLPDDEENNRNI